MKTKRIPAAVALSTFIVLQPVTAAAANEAPGGKSNSRLDKIIEQSTLPSFTVEEKKQIESSLRESLDINKLISLGDIAFDAEDYAKSLSLYQRAFYTGKLIGPNSDTDENESNDDEDTKSSSAAGLPRVSSVDFQLRLAENEMLMAHYPRALEILEGLLKEQAGNDLASVRTLNFIAEIHRINGQFQQAKESLNLATEIAADNKLLDAATVETKLTSSILESEANSPLEEIKQLESIAAEAAPFGKAGKRIQLKSALEQAKLYQSRYQLTKAEERLKFALELSKKTFGEESLEVADCLVYLSLLELPTEAQRLAYKAASIQMRHLETISHPSVATTLFALSENPSLKCREKELLCVTGLTSIDGILNDESPLGLGGLRLLIYAQMKAKKNMLAVKGAERYLQLTEKLYGNDSLKYARALMDMAVVLAQSSFYSEGIVRLEGGSETPQTTEGRNRAFLLATSASDLIGKLTGPESLNSAACLDTRVWMLLRANKKTDAVEAAKAALRICDKSADVRGASKIREFVGESIRDVAIKNRDWKLAQQGLAERVSDTITRYGVCSRKFVDVFKEAELIKETMLKEEISEQQKHDKDALSDSASAQPLGTSFAIAESMSLKILQMLPTEETGLADIMSMLMNHYRAPNITQTLEERELSLKNLLRGQRTMWGSDSPCTTRQLVDLGSFYQTQKRFEDSERSFSSAEKNIQTGLGVDHPQLLEVLPQYAAMLRAKGQIKKPRRKRQRQPKFAKSFPFRNPSRESFLSRQLLRFSHFAFIPASQNEVSRSTTSSTFHSSLS